ncbi:cytochrome C oxidase subunit IV family protein [Haloferula chungangensis]|uniref:Cytochrome C oxidase subunit IV family protein n=1 Tax=Haloferula chungangensis TaxID=1048331 RepID=A0ABW2L0N1_9BACT
METTVPSKENEAASQGRASEPMAGEMHPHNQASAASIEAVRRSLKLYLYVGVFLFVATGATYAVATVPWLDVGAHGFDKWDAILGLAIASVKVSAVALIYMHLNHEKKLIYWLFGLAIIHAIGCFIGTYWHFADMTHDKYFYGDPDSADRALLGMEQRPDDRK